MRDNKFAAEFLARRKARGLTQRACAALCGVSTVTVWNWEQGRSAPWGKDQAKILLTIGEDAPKAETFAHGGEYKHRVAHSGPVPTFPKPVAPGGRRLIDNFGDIGL